MTKSSLIIIILKHRNSTYRKNEVEGNFWEPFFDSADRVRGEYTEREDVEVLEGKIRTNFPVQLKEFLVSFNPPVSAPDFEVKSDISSGVAIAVDYIKEGSLEIGLSMEPIEKLAQFFDNNFTYFEIFLRCYIPIAFLQALEPQYPANYIGWKEVINQLDIDVRASSDMLYRFQPVKAQPINNKNKSFSVASKANWLWIISNTSLVVPVLLTTFILYLAFVELKERRTTLDKQFENIHLRQTELIRILIKELQVEELENDSIQEEEKPK